MPRERKEFKRESFFRDVQKLFVIATEGTKTEVKYFEEFKSDQYYNNQTLFVEVLKRLTTDSSPDDVIAQLNSFMKEYRLRDGDELWMVIDRDKQSWKPKQISQIARLCIQKGYGFALSNPCFEAWLLLHRRNYHSYSHHEQVALFLNRKKGNRTALESELLVVCGSYDKSNINVADYLPFINEAIINAEVLIDNPAERWPSHFGSHVYKLVKKLLPI